MIGGPVIAVLVIWKYVLKKPEDSDNLPKDKN